MVAQRKALLAWTGNTLSLSPRLNTKMVWLARSSVDGVLLTYEEPCTLG